MARIPMTWWPSTSQGWVESPSQKTPLCPSSSWPNIWLKWSHSLLRLIHANYSCAAPPPSTPSIVWCAALRRKQQLLTLSDKLSALHLTPSSCFCRMSGKLCLIFWSASQPLHFVWTKYPLKVCILRQCYSYYSTRTKEHKHFKIIFRKGIWILFQNLSKTMWPLLPPGLLPHVHIYIERIPCLAGAT